MVGIQTESPYGILVLLMCLDNKKLLCLETVMATNPWMYSRTQKKQQGKKQSSITLFHNITSTYTIEIRSHLVEMQLNDLKLILISNK